MSLTMHVASFKSTTETASRRGMHFKLSLRDLHQDRTVDATDVSLIDNDAANFAAGYIVTDLTGDNFVDGTDFAIADNNAANFVSAALP